MKARSPRAAAFAAIALALSFALGCSGAGPTTATTSPTATSTPTTPASPGTPAPSTAPPSQTPLSVTIGDAPSQRVASFEVTVTSVILNAADGSQVNVFSGSRRVEVTHLAGTFAPLVLSSVPQGTYTQLQVTLADPEVSFVGDDASLHNFADVGFTRTLTIVLTPPLAVTGTTAMMLNLDLNAAASIAIDPATNTVTINPVITVGSQPADEQQHEPEAGELEHIAGTVTAVNVSAGTFTISAGQSGLTLTFATNTNTRFDIGGTQPGTVASLAAGMVVRVDGVTQSDGTLLATEVEASQPATTAVDAEGLVTSITGNPVTEFTLLAQDANDDHHDGEDDSRAMVGGALSVNVDASTQFTVDAGGLAFDPAAFPFDAAHLSKAQRVEADSTTPPQIMTGASSSTVLSAQQVRLQAQALTGTVSNQLGSSTSGQFTLTVAPDSAFALLTGTTTVTVFSQTQTDTRQDAFNDDRGGDGGGNGGTAPVVRVRGLLFFDGTAYKMLASRVEAEHD